MNVSAANFMCYSINISVLWIIITKGQILPINSTFKKNNVCEYQANKCSNGENIKKSFKFAGSYLGKRLCLWAL